MVSSVTGISPINKNGDISASYRPMMHVPLRPDRHVADAQLHKQFMSCFRKPVETHGTSVSQTLDVHLLLDSPSMQPSRWLPHSDM